MCDDKERERASNVTFTLVHIPYHFISLFFCFSFLSELMICCCIKISGFHCRTRPPAHTHIIISHIKKIRSLFRRSAVVIVIVMCRVWTFAAFFPRHFFWLLRQCNFLLWHVKLMVCIAFGSDLIDSIGFDFFLHLFGRIHSTLCGCFISSLLQYAIRYFPCDSGSEERKKNQVQNQPINKIPFHVNCTILVLCDMHAVTGYYCYRTNHAFLRLSHTAASNLFTSRTGKKYTHI